MDFPPINMSNMKHKEPLGGDSNSSRSATSTSSASSSAPSQVAPTSTSTLPPPPPPPPSSISAIKSFYSGKSILVTGATGFIGKVLIEKILYSCPDVGKIYLLIRGAKGKSPHERLAEMIADKPFNIRLKSEFVSDKLVAIESDLSKRQLGLSADNSSILINDVSIVFHVAASVKFEAPLEVNMCHNVVATRELLEFACKFRQLHCFVHVSTAYSNCQLRQIDERIYPMHVPDDPMSMRVTKAMIDNRPNTYTYTKAMAENVASKYASRVNVVIVRPSIVMSAMREPTEGWVDTINGPVGLSVLGALGILQKIKVNSGVVFDLIPVDIVSNALISIAWASTVKRAEFLPGSSPSLALSLSNGSRDGGTASDHNQTVISSSSGSGSSSNNNNNNNNYLSAAPIKSAIAKKIELFQQPRGVAGAKLAGSNSSATGEPNTGSLAAPQPQPPPPPRNNLDGTVRVFNLTTGNENPCSFYNYFSIGREEAYIKPSTKALRPLLTIRKQLGMNSIKYWLHKIFTHLLFAYLVDALLGLCGRKKMVVKAVKRMHHANEMFDYFCSNQWNFVTDNMKRLLELQGEQDRRTFYCDVREIDWCEYAKIGWMGCRRFILRESDDTVSYAKRRYRAICLLYYFVKLVLVAALTSLIYSFAQLSLAASSLILVPVYGVVYLV